MFKVVTEFGEYCGIVADSEWQARRIVWRMLAGRERIVAVIREGV